MLFSLALPRSSWRSVRHGVASQRCRTLPDLVEPKFFPSRLEVVTVKFSAPSTSHCWSIGQQGVLQRQSKPENCLHICSLHVQIGSSMAGSEEVSGLTASLGELHVEASSSKDSEVSRLGNAVDHVAIADDEIWDDGSDSPGHESTLDREWVHRQNQFHKMGYRDGIAEGQKDIAQEGFNIGFGQSVHVGYKWGLVRGITSALASLSDSLKEKLLPSVQCRGQLQDLNNSVQEISAEDALQIFHENILRSSHSSEEPRVTLNRATDSSRLQNLSKDLVLLLHECPDMKVSEELTRDS